MKIRDILSIPALVIVAALQMGGSCASNPDSGNSSGTSDQNSQNYDRPNRIPHQSDLVRDGTGKLKWTADLDGEIYVYDPAKDHIDYTGPVKRGQEVVVNPKDDKVTIGDRVVSSEDLRKDNTHQIYFARHHENHNGNGDWNHLPGMSKSVAEGKGEISYRASGNGTIWVADADDSRVLIRKAIKSKSTIVITPSKDRVTIDGQTVYDQNLVKDHVHRIYFDRD